MILSDILRRVSEYTEDDMHIDVHTPNVVVVGVGGSGCNTVSRMKYMGLEVPTIAINTDMSNLSMITADTKILLKTLDGMGTGGNVEVGETCAVRAREHIMDAMDGADIVFITTGLGGGTGTGATPVVAELAQELGALVISIVSLPFAIEKAHMSKAKEGLRRIVKSSNTVIVLDNDKLLDIVPNRPLNEAFMVMDHLIGYTIMSFVDMITKPSLINIDLADLRFMLGSGNLSTILISEGSTDDVRKIVTDALNNPLLNVDYSSADGALIHITAGEDVPVTTIYSAVDTIASFLSRDPKITMGARVDPEFMGRMRILVVLTGIKVPFLAESVSKVSVWDEEFEVR